LWTAVWIALDFAIWNVGFFERCLERANQNGFPRCLICWPFVMLERNSNVSRTVFGSLCSLRFQEVINHFSGWPAFFDPQPRTKHRDRPYIITHLSKGKVLKKWAQSAAELSVRLLYNVCVSLDGELLHCTPELALHIICKGVLQVCDLRNVDMQIKWTRHYLADGLSEETG